MNGSPSVRIMADYDCFPLWILQPDGAYDNVDPGDILASESIRNGLRRWADIYDGTLDRSDPASSGFRSPREHQLFVEWGRSLAHASSNLLRDSVLYFDDIERVDFEIFPESIGD